MWGTLDRHRTAVGRFLPWANVARKVREAPPSLADCPLTERAKG